MASVTSGLIARVVLSAPALLVTCNHAEHRTQHEHRCCACQRWVTLALYEISMYVETGA